jgi:hypothetical protein
MRAGHKRRVRDLLGLQGGSVQCWGGIDTIGECRGIVRAWVWKYPPPDAFLSDDDT